MVANFKTALLKLEPRVVPEEAVTAPFREFADWTWKLSPDWSRPFQLVPGGG